jgi:hypothetical protein
MNDIIKLILLNIILFGLLYYDKRCGIVLIIFMVIYWITIKSSIKSKLVEGYGFYSNFVEMPQFIKNDYGAVLPTSVQNNSDERGYSNMFSFYKGGGHQGTVKTDNLRLEETNELLDKLIGMFDKKQQNCMGEFEKYSECSRECGYGKQEKIYRIIQEKGENGVDCDYKEGKIIKKPCILRDCDIDEKCKHNYECRSRYCDPVTNKCDRLDKCDKNHLYHCYSEDECEKLNKKYKYESKHSKYVWDKNDKKCYFKYKPRVEYSIYEKPVEYPEEVKYKCDGDDGKCKEDNTGEYESLTECEKVCSPTCKLDCGEHGTLDEGKCECVCDVDGDWGGPTCGECGLTCGDHGTLNEDEGNCECDCDVGWEGPTCGDCGLTCENNRVIDAGKCECVCDEKNNFELNGDECVCEDGYSLNGDECKKNGCRCKGGTPIDECLVDGEEKCKSCNKDEHFILDSDKCVCDEKNNFELNGDECVCKEGYSSNGDGDECKKNVCKCNNGIPSDLCIIKDSEVCESCDKNFVLKDGKCVCDEDKHFKLDDDDECVCKEEYSSNGDECKKNVCRCKGGTPIDECLVDGEEKCKSCDVENNFELDEESEKCVCEDGYSLNGDECVIVKQYRCNCKEGKCEERKSGDDNFGGTFNSEKQCIDDTGGCRKCRQIKNSNQYGCVWAGNCNDAYIWFGVGNPEFLPCRAQSAGGSCYLDENSKCQHGNSSLFENDASMASGGWCYLNNEN